MTEAQKDKIKKDKYERLNWLREQYRKMQLGASKEEKIALKCESAVLAKRLEVVSRGER